MMDVTTKQAITKSVIEQLLRKKSDRVDLKVNDKGKSDVWKNFQLVCVDGETEPYACCQKCKIVVAYNGKTGTGSLQRHKCSGIITIDKNQSSLTGFVKKCIPNSRKELMASMEVAFVTKDLRPFKALEDPGFRALGQELINLGADYGKVAINDVLVGRDAIARTHLPKQYNITKKKVAAIFDQTTAGIGSCGSFTTDLWTDEYNQRSFISLTLHTITQDFTLQSVVLATREFFGKHLARNIRKAILSIIAEYSGDDASAEKCIKHSVFVTDNGANVVAAFKKPSPINLDSIRDEDNSADKEDDEATSIAYRRLSCACHSLNLAVNFVLVKKVDEVPNLTDFLSDCKKLVKYFKKSGLNSKLSKTLKQDVSTRWNSVYTMLTSILEVFEEVKHLLLEADKLEKLANIKKNVLSELTLFLGTFKKCSEKLSAEKTPTLQEYSLWKIKLLKHCQPTLTDSQMTLKIKQLMKEGLIAKFKPNALHNAALFLHPNFKSLRILKTTEKNEAISLIKGLMEDEKHRKAEQQSTENSANAKEDEPTKKRPRVERDFDEFMDVVDNSDEEHADELQMYHEQKFKFTNSCDSDEVDILHYWRDCQSEFPTLAQVARRILSIPASSAASERLFSRAGRVLEERRTSLSSTHADQVLFLHHNL